MKTTRPTALVTGGAVRLGQAIAIGLAQDGYAVALHYHQSEEAALKTQHHIHEIGGTCELFKADLTVPGMDRILMDQVVDRFSTLNLLINNASLFENISFMETTPEIFDTHFTLNLRTPFFLTQYFAAANPQQGHVINLLDTRIVQVRQDYFAYTMTKKCLTDFTKMAALALGPHIRVNGICPGPVLPPPGKDASYLVEKAKRLPVHEIGSTDSILQALRYLQNNRAVTGDTLFVDSGEHLQ